MVGRPGIELAGHSGAYRRTARLAAAEESV
jgi:hypothetical protein